ncbi:MAG: hypothetical protein QFX32_01245 [Methanolinea sp.]|nr:hypothetical protein [Methanolinea sp.]
MTARGIAGEGHRRFRATRPRAPAYIVVLCVNWPELETLQGLVERIVGLSRDERFFPHVTLCGPLTLRRGADILPLLDRALRDLSPPGRLHPLHLEMFRGRKGIAVSLVLREDPPLAACARAVASALVPSCTRCNTVDTTGGRILHVSVAVNLRRGKGERVYSLLRGPRGALASEAQRLLRGRPPLAHAVAVIRRGTLWRAYDFSLREWVDRSGIFRARATRRKGRLAGKNGNGESRGR